MILSAAAAWVSGKGFPNPGINLVKQKSARMWNRRKFLLPLCLLGCSEIILSKLTNHANWVTHFVGNIAHHFLYNEYHLYMGHNFQFNSLIPSRNIWRTECKPIIINPHWLRNNLPSKPLSLHRCSKQNELTSPLNPTVQHDIYKWLTSLRVPLS